jgi:hypothetical protein
MNTLTKKQLIYIVSAVVLIGLFLVVRASYVTAPTSQLDEVKVGEVEFEGQVQSVDLSPLAYDGSAQIVVATSSRDQLVEVPARLNLCPAVNNIDSLDGIVIGQTIAVRGSRDSNGTVVVCADESQYLRVSGGQDEAPTSPGTDTNEPDTDTTAATVGVVSVGNPVVINGINVSVDGVSEDSRCPADVNCVWEGQLVASFNFSAGNQQFTQTLTLGGSAAAVFGKKAKLIDVRPLANSEAQITLSDYQFTIEIL